MSWSSWVVLKFYWKLLLHVTVHFFYYFLLSREKNNCLRGNIHCLKICNYYDQLIRLVNNSRIAGISFIILLRSLISLYWLLSCIRQCRKTENEMINYLRYHDDCIKAIFETHLTNMGLAAEGPETICHDYANNRSIPFAYNEPADKSTNPPQ